MKSGFFKMLHHKVGVTLDVMPPDWSNKLEIIFFIDFVLTLIVMIVYRIVILDNT